MTDAFEQDAVDEWGEQRDQETPLRPLIRVDLVERARRGIQPPQFAVDGRLYRGYVHSLAGPPDSGKTTIGTWWVLTVLRSGHPAVVLDEESGADAYTEKLLALGAKPDELIGLHYYPFPGRSWDAADLAGLYLVLEEVRPALLLGDSMSALLAAGDKDEDRAGDVRRFIQRVLLEPARKYGHAAFYIDHMRKDGGGGRYARGSGDKLATVDVAYIVGAAKPFNRKQSGSAKLTVTKDRRGYLHRDLDVAFTVDDGQITVSIADASPDDGPAGMAPAAVKVLAALRGAPDAWLTVKEIGDRVKEQFGGKGLTRQTLAKGCATLAEDGFIDMTSQGKGKANLWQALPE